MSAVYKKVSDQMGLSPDSQGLDGFIHGLLKYADANHSGGDVSNNPYSEVVRRLEAVPGFNPYFLTVIKARLNDGERQFAAGRP